MMTDRHRPPHPACNPHAPGQSTGAPNDAQRETAIAAHDAKLREEKRGARWLEVDHLEPAALAAVLRKELARVLPKGVKLSVTSHYSGHVRSVRAVVKAVPRGLPIANPDRVRFTMLHPHACFLGAPARHTPEAAALLALIERTAGAFNFDCSDSISDYWHAGFFFDAAFDGDLENAEAAACRATLEAIGF